MWFRVLTSRNLSASCWVVVALVSSALACSSDKNGDLNDERGSGGTGAQIILNVAGAGARPGSEGAGPLPGCGAPEVNGCAGISYEGESVPLDLYVMFDQSGSMLNDVGGMTRLKAVQRAMAEFLRAPESDAIGVGIGYFGQQPIGQASCDAGEYTSPAVGITLDHEQVITSLNGREPTGETPTAAALRGACAHASAWKRDNPGRSVAILLVTDGVPEAPVTCASGQCCPTLEDATRAAAECAAGKPSIATYVLGVGPALGNLSAIANAGLTKQAYLVEDQNATTDVLRALNAIRGDALVPCDLEIPKPPPGEALDYGRVNLHYSSTGCDFEPLYYVETATRCAENGGWFYDDPTLPTTVKLCPSSCDRVSRPGTSLSFSVGCQTLSSPIR